MANYKCYRIIYACTTNQLGISIHGCGLKLKTGGIRNSRGWHRTFQGLQ